MVSILRNPKMALLTLIARASDGLPLSSSYQGETVSVRIMGLCLDVLCNKRVVWCNYVYLVLSN